MDGHHVTSFGEHGIIDNIHVQDSKGEQRTYDATVEAVSTHGFGFIFGLDWLEHANPNINWASRELTHRCASQQRRHGCQFRMETSNLQTPSTRLHPFQARDRSDRQANANLVLTFTDGVEVETIDAEACAQAILAEVRVFVTHPRPIVAKGESSAVTVRSHFKYKILYK